MMSRTYSWTMRSLVNHPHARERGQAGPEPGGMGRRRAHRSASGVRHSRRNRAARSGGQSRAALRAAEDGVAVDGVRDKIVFKEREYRLEPLVAGEEIGRTVVVEAGKRCEVLTEGEEIFPPLILSASSMFPPLRLAIVTVPFSANFMPKVPHGSIPAVEQLLRKVNCRCHAFGPAERGVRE